MAQQLVDLVGSSATSSVSSAVKRKEAFGPIDGTRVPGTLVVSEI